MPCLLQATPSKQPSQGALINWGHSLAKGLVFACYPVGQGAFDAVMGTYAGGLSAVVGRKTVDGNQAAARELRTTVATFAEYQAGLDRLVGNFSIFCEGSVLTNGTASMVARSFSPTTGNGIGFKFDDAEQCLNGFYLFGDNGNRSPSNYEALGADSELYRHRAMITGDGTNANFYAKGGLDRTVAETFTPTAGTNRQTTILTSGAGALSLFLAYSRVLSLSEYKTLYEDPWVVFRSPGVRLWSAVVGGGGAPATLVTRRSLLGVGI